MQKTNIPKTVMAIHDLSSFGRCALTVILPVLAVQGIQGIPLPTALLSTHTGGFTDYAFRDLTKYMNETIEHWEKLGLSFNAIYSGFLGSTEQCDVVTKAIKKFKKHDTFVLVDPVMGDNGKLYSTMNSDMIKRMRLLCSYADIITPNVTEALFLLDKNGNYDINIKYGTLNKDKIETMLSSLAEFGICNIVMTGIHSYDNIITAVYSSGEVFFHEQPRLNCFYPGTGDVFASVLLGKMLRGENIFDSCEFASDFVWRVMEGTLNSGNPSRYGVFLENYLKYLI